MWNSRFPCVSVCGFLYNVGINEHKFKTEMSQVPVKDTNTTCCFFTCRHTLCSAEEVTAIRQNGSWSPRGFAGWSPRLSSGLETASESSNFLRYYLGLFLWILKKTITNIQCGACSAQNTTVKTESHLLCCVKITSDIEMFYMGAFLKQRTLRNSTC